jgi:hypothetical protein
MILFGITCFILGAAVASVSAYAWLVAEILTVRK